MDKDTIDHAIEDNVFCAAILKILEIPGILEEDSPTTLEDVAKHFHQNGYHSDDEDFVERKALESKQSKLISDEVKKRESHECNDDDFLNRKPLANKSNKIFPKKLQKLAKAQKFTYCRFCENNQESWHVYNSHSLRDSSGNLTCPRLRKYVCPICGASGDTAHTVRYCTKKPIFTIKDQSGEVTKIRSSTTLHRTSIRL